MSRDQQPAIRDNAERGRFEMTVGDAVAFLEYARGPSELVLVHTEVPEELRGRGLAGRLARHAFELAEAGGLRVEPVCPFQVAWVARHPEVHHLLHRASGRASIEPFWF